MTSPIALASVAAALLLTLTACGNAATSPEAAITASPVSGSVTMPRPPGTVINVSITSTSAASDKATVQVGLNQPVSLIITAAAVGELHVHSTPEKHIEYPKGTSVITLKFDLPGTVVIEDHALDQQVTQIQVN